MAALAAVQRPTTIHSQDLIDFQEAIASNDQENIRDLACRIIERWEQSTRDLPTLLANFDNPNLTPVMKNHLLRVACPILSERTADSTACYVTGPVPHDSVHIYIQKVVRAFSKINTPADQHRPIDEGKVIERIVMTMQRHPNLRIVALGQQAEASLAHIFKAPDFAIEHPHAVAPTPQAEAPQAVEKRPDGKDDHVFIKRPSSASQLDPGSCCLIL